MTTPKESFPMTELDWFHKSLEL